MNSHLAMIDADNLATLALAAATQLDRIKRHEPADWKKINSFADCVAKLSPSASGATGDTLLNALSSEMLGAAVMSATDKHIVDVGQLQSELTKLVADLRNTPPEVAPPADQLGTLITFCLGVYDTISKHRLPSNIHDVGIFDYDHNFAD